MAEIHPAQLLFTEKHPLTAVFNMKFHPGENHVLDLTLNAPASFADRGGKYVHTGFNTLILDTVMGACAIGELKEMKPIATIKLTCNHLHKLKVDEPLICRASWDGEEHSIAYVRGEIRTGKEQRLISNAVGTFMVGTATRPLGDRK